jgi:hypothetical protein
LGRPPKLPFGIHPTCCGIRLGSSSPIRVWTLVRCNKYLGHKNIQHTVRYNKLSPERFRNFWRIRKRHPKTDGDTAAFRQVFGGGFPVQDQCKNLFDSARCTYSGQLGRARMDCPDAGAIPLSISIKRGSQPSSRWRRPAPPASDPTAVKSEREAPMSIQSERGRALVHQCQVGRVETAGKMKAPVSPEAFKN